MPRRPLVLVALTLLHGVACASPRDVPSNDEGHEVGAATAGAQGAPASHLRAETDPGTAAAGPDRATAGHRGATAGHRRAPAVTTPPEASPTARTGPEDAVEGGPIVEDAPAVTAARRQIGVTVTYDPSYVRLAYPNGDVPADRGVCTDVIIRALRDAHGFDLQQAVHQDMRRAFSKYPAIWRAKRPDRNIDHRRVPNLRRFFERRGWSRPVTRDPADYRPGDIVTCTVAGNRPHIMIVSDRRTPGGVPLIIHNIGAGAREEDSLFAYPLTGHYRPRL